jgi:hypothetical protein
MAGVMVAVCAHLRRESVPHIKYLLRSGGRGTFNANVQRPDKSDFQSTLFASSEVESDYVLALNPNGGQDGDSGCFEAQNNINSRTC